MKKIFNYVSCIIFTVIAGDGWSSDNSSSTIFIPDQRLFYSDDELELWRDRAEAGPYKVRSDVSPNSPGDWQVISDNKKRFVAKPLEHYFDPDAKPKNAEGCYTDISLFPNHYATRLRDAAFYGRVKNDKYVLSRAREHLLLLARDEKLDFSNKSAWCPGENSDTGPSFHLAEWMTRLVLAYDFLYYDLSEAERQELLQWFLNFAEFMQDDLNVGLDTVFVDRYNNNYSFKTSYKQETRDPAYIGGPNIPRVGYFYNNRRANMARAVGIIGVLMNKPELTRHGARFCEEFLKYAVFPDGSIAEFERNTHSLPDLGWQYGMGTLGPCLTLGAVMARAGDNSLLEYSTVDGKKGSTDGRPDNYPGKSLEFVSESMVSYLDGTYLRYFFGGSISDDFLIDGRNPRDGSKWNSAGDTALAFANQYFNNDHIREVYRRTQPGTIQYPQKAAGFGSHYGFGGEASIFPGVLFMYEQDIKAEGLPAISGVSIVNTALSGSQVEITPIHGNEFVINQSLYPEGFSLIAENSFYFGSVEFYINGKKHRLENVSPFTINGDSGSDSNRQYTPLQLDPGTYQIRMRPYLEKKARGAVGSDVVITLIVQDDAQTISSSRYLRAEEDACPDHSTRAGIVEIPVKEEDEYVDIQAVIDAKPPGTEFFLWAGEDYRRLSYPLIPKQGQKFFGELGLNEKGECVHKTVLAGSVKLNNQAFKTVAGRDQVWVYDYSTFDATKDFPGTNVSVDYIFRNEQFDQYSAVVNYACEFKNHTRPGTLVSPDNDLINPRCSDPKAIYVDNNRLYHVATLDALEYGKFFHDYEAKRIYMAVNPEGKHIEFSYNYAAAVATKKPWNIKANPDEMVWKAIEEMNHFNAHKDKNNGLKRETAKQWNIEILYDGNTDVAFHDLAFRHFAASNHFAALPGGAAKSGWTISNNVFEFNSGAAVAVGPDNTISRNVLRFNGQYGLVGRDAHNALVTNNEITNNNIARVCYTAGAKYKSDGTLDVDGHCPAGGGNKFSNSFYLKITNNCSMSNNGPGFWTDIANTNTTYDNNLAMFNTRSGIYHEISYEADIINNTLAHNASHELYINDSQGINVTGNTITTYHQDFPERLVKKYLDNPGGSPLPASVQLTYVKRGGGHYGTQDGDIIHYVHDGKQYVLDDIDINTNTLIVDNSRIAPFDYTIKPDSAHKSDDTYDVYIQSLQTRIDEFLSSSDSDGNIYSTSLAELPKFRFLKSELSHIDNRYAPENYQGVIGYNGIKSLAELKSGSFTSKQGDYTFNWQLEDSDSSTVNLNVALDKTYSISNCQDWYKGK